VHWPISVGIGPLSWLPFKYLRRVSKRARVDEARGREGAVSALSRRG
jgi:hypothetical protein